MSETSNFIAVLACPVCGEELATHESPHIDWKRGFTRLHIKPTEEASGHLLDCLISEASEEQLADATEGQAGGTEPESQAKAPADERAETGAEESVEIPAKSAPAAKPRSSKNTSSK